MSALDLCRWSQNGTLLMDYVDFKSLHSASGMSFLRRGPLSVRPSTQTAMLRPVCSLCSQCSWSECSLGLPFVGVGGGHHYSWPCPRLVSHSLSGELPDPGRSPCSPGFSLAQEYPLYTAIPHPALWNAPALELIASASWWISNRMF